MNVTPIINSIAQYGLLGLLLALALVAIAYLYKSKEKAVSDRDAKLEELNRWVRKHAEDSIKAFNAVSNLVDNVMVVAERTEGNISEKIEIQANDIKSHISLEVERLKRKTT